MVCKSCNSPNSDQHKFCAQCGSSLAVPVGATANSSAAGSKAADLVPIFAALDAGDTDTALTVAMEVLARDPQSPGAHLALSEVYERRGEPEEAAHQRQLAEAGAKVVSELVALTAIAPPFSPIRRQRPVWVFAAGALVCLGLIVGGVGVGHLLAGRGKGDATAGSSIHSMPGVGASQPPTYRTGSLTGSPSVPRPAAPRTAAVYAATAPKGVAPASPPRRGFQMRVSTTPAFAPTFAPPERIGLPQVIDHRPGARQEPMTAAAVGEVRPIGSQGSTGASPAAPGPIALQATPGRTTLPVTGAVVGPRAAVTTIDANSEKKNGEVELSGPERGFIRIERNSANGSPSGSAPSTPAAPANTASASVAQGPRPVAEPDGRATANLLEGARREERLGMDAIREGLVDEAQSHLRSAYRMYGAVARQGGPEAAAARSRAAYCVRALATLR